MKHFLVLLLSFTLGVTAYAQKDTTLINSSQVSFNIDQRVTKTGEKKSEYYALYKGVYYVTDKTSYKRYVTSKRFGASPNVALVTDEKSKAKKVIVL